MQNGETALIHASKNGHTSTARVLLQKGALVNRTKKVSIRVLKFIYPNHDAYVV